MTTPCPHLENLISEKPGKPSFEGTNRQIYKSVDAFYYTSGAGIVIPEGVRSGKYEEQFKAKLQKTNLSDIQKDILVLKYIYSTTIKDIAQELGIASLGYVMKLHSDALKYLKKTGFGKR